MTGNIVRHPHHGLMAEAEYERRVVDSAEAEKLKDAIYDAVGAYSDFLDRHGLIWEGIDPDSIPSNPDGMPRMRASALVVTADYVEHYGTIDITLKDGACDRVYGDGVNPDPYGSGPSDIPGRRHRDEA